jgi:hypothetical protein
MAINLFLPTARLYKEKAPMQGILPGSYKKINPGIKSQILRQPFMHLLVKETAVICF